MHISTKFYLVIHFCASIEKKKKEKFILIIGKSLVPSPHYSLHRDSCTREAFSRYALLSPVFIVFAEIRNMYEHKQMPV